MTTRRLSLTQISQDVMRPDDDDLDTEAISGTSEGHERIEAMLGQNGDTVDCEDDLVVKPSASPSPPSSSTTNHSSSSSSSSSSSAPTTSLWRKVASSLGFEKGYKTLTFEDIDRVNTASGAVSAMRLSSERLLGVPPDFSAAKLNFKGNERLIFSSLHCLIRVLSSPKAANRDVKRAIGKAGGVGFLSNILRPLIGNPDVVWRALHCVYLLSSEPSNRVQMGEDGYCEILATILFDYISKIGNEPAATDASDNMEHCLQAIKHLCDDPQNQLALYRMDVCTAVLTVFRKYVYWPTDTSRVVLCCCKLIYNLSYDCDPVKERFHHLNCVPELLDVMRETSRYYVDVHVQEWLFRALSALCSRCDANKNSLTEAGGLDLVADSVLLKRCSGEAVLTLVSNIAYPHTSNQSYFVQQGCIPAIVELMTELLQEFISTASIKSSVGSTNSSTVVSKLTDVALTIEAALKALRSICHNLAEGTTACYDCRAERVVLSIIKYFGVDCLLTSLSSTTQSVTQWALFALCSLGGTDDERLSALAKEGACDVVSGTLLKQITSASVSQWACHAVGKLSSLSENAIRLEEAWVCRGLSLSINKHIDDEDVLEEASVAIVNLCKRYDKNRYSLSSVSICENLYAAVKKHIQSEAVLMSLFPAVAALSSAGSKDVVTIKLGQVGFCRLICKAIKAYTTNPVISKAVFHCIYSLASIPEYSTELGSIETCTALVEAVAYQATDVEAVCMFLNACTSLCTVDANIKRLGTTSIPKWIISLIDHCMDDEAIVYVACHTLSELASDVDCCEKVGSLQGCQMLVNILSGHRKNELIVSYCCRTVGKLANNSKRNAQRFTDDGMCVAVAAALEAHGERQLVCQFICDAITGIATNCAASRTKFNSVQICELIVAVLRRYNDNDFVVAATLQAGCALLDRCNPNQISFVAADISSILCSTLIKYNAQLVPGQQQANTNACVVVEYGCMCIVRLLSNTGVPKEKLQRQLAEDSGCIALTACLDHNVEVASIAEPALQGIALMADDFGENAVIFIAIAASEAISRAVKYHISSETICLAGTTALARFKSKNGTLCSENVCKVVPIVLHRHAHVDVIVEHTCRLIYTLCKGFSKSQENAVNREMLGASNACEEVVAALERHTSNEASLLIASSSSRASAALAVQWACLAIYVLGHEHVGHQERFGQSNACAVVARAVSSSNNGFADSETAAYAACQAICALAKNNKKHQIALGTAGVCASVIDALHTHPASVGIARWGLLAVSCLAENSESNASRFGDHGATSIIPLTLHTHQTSAAVALSGCAAIKSIANVSLSFTAELGQYGACECTIATLSLHVTDPLAVAEALRAIASLSRYLGNASWFGPARAAEAIITAVKSHQQDSAVVEAAYLAIERLCIDSYMAERLGLADALSTAVDAMGEPLAMSSESLTYVVCRAVGRLVKHGGVQQKLNKHLQSVTGTLIRSMDQFSSSSFAIVTEAAKALVYILRNVSDEVEHNSIYSSITGVSLSVQDTARRIDLKGVQEVLAQQGLCTVLAKILRYVFGTVTSSVEGDDKEQEQPVQESHFSWTLKCFQVHDVRVQQLWKFLFYLVHHIAQGNADNQEMLLNAGVCDYSVVALEIVVASTSVALYDTSDNFLECLSAILKAVGSMASGSSTVAATTRQRLGQICACEVVAVILGRLLTEQQKSVDGAAAFVSQKGRGHIFHASRIGSYSTSVTQQQTGGFFRRKVNSEHNLTTLVDTTPALSSSAPTASQGSKQVLLKVVRVTVQTCTLLLQHCKDNRQRFASAGMAEVLVNILSESRFLEAVNTISVKIDRDIKVVEYLDSTIIECSLLALHSLSSEPLGKDRLVMIASFCAKTVLNVATSKEDGSGLVTFLTASICTRLCQYGCEPCQSAFGDLGAVEWLLAVLHKLCAFWYKQCNDKGGLDSNSASSVSPTGSSHTKRSGPSPAAGSTSKPRRQSMLEAFSSVVRSSTESGKSSGSERKASMFSSSFSAESSRSLAEECCRSLLSLITNQDLEHRSGEHTDAVAQLHSLNLIKAKTALVEGSTQPYVDGVDVLRGGRDVLSCVIGHFVDPSRGVEGVEGAEGNSSAIVLRLATGVLEVVKPPLALLVAQMKGAGTQGKPMVLQPSPSTPLSQSQSSPEVIVEEGENAPEALFESY